MKLGKQSKRFVSLRLNSLAFIFVFKVKMNSERNFGSLKFDQFCIEMLGGFKSEIIFQEIIMLQRLQRAKQWGNQSYYNLRWCSN